MLKTIFFGTPEFAVSTLQALLETGNPPLLVVSQPARPVGRGRKLQDPPVARWAREHGLEVRQPEKVREAGFLEELKSLAPDVAVVVAFGQIFRRTLLELPRCGCINLHGSLLPRYRGAAPIQAAIAAGERVTGVTTMRMDAGLDSGPMLLKAELPIGDDETAAELAPRLAERGAALMVETLRCLEEGTLVETPQEERQATHAPRLSKADAVVDWRLSAQEIYDRLRAYTPWPGLSSGLRGEPLKILAGRPLTLGELTPAEPGTLAGMLGDCLAVHCGSEGATILGLRRVQRPGKKPISATDFVNGEHAQAGERFG